MATRTGVFVPGSSITTPGPIIDPADRRDAADIRDAVELRLRAVEADAGDQMVLQAEHVVGVGHLQRGAIAVRVGGLVVQLRIRIGQGTQEGRNRRPAARRAGTPGAWHSRPEPSLHGVSFGALPLATRWTKFS